MIPPGVVSRESDLDHLNTSFCNRFVHLLVPSVNTMIMNTKLHVMLQETHALEGRVIIFLAHNQKSDREKSKPATFDIDIIF